MISLKPLIRPLAAALLLAMLTGCLPGSSAVPLDGKTPTGEAAPTTADTQAAAVPGTEQAKSPSAAPSPGEALTVAAAADLQFAFTDIARMYEEQTGEKVTLVFGSTGQLVQQIENGAPFDLIAAADVSYIGRLVKQNLVFPESAQRYARGELVLAVNRESGIRAETLQDLLSPDIHHIAIANPDHAPYGAAAKQALEASGLWEKLQGRLVYGENVRQAMQFVQTGDAEVGLVSRSVVDVPEVTWTPVDPGLYDPLEQALAIVRGTQYREQAQDFINFLNSRQGREVMTKYGFRLPGKTGAPVMTPEIPPSP